MIIVEYVVANQCKNREESWDLLCIKCGKCGRVFNDNGIKIDDGGTTPKEDLDGTNGQMHLRSWNGLG